MWKHWDQDKNKNIMTNTKRNIGRYNNIKFNKCSKAKIIDRKIEATTK